jgi:hypothetical protein
MPLNLKTASGGSVIITGADTASDKTITVPAADGNMQLIQQGTAVASTSGTSIDFTSIPSWVKRITVMFSGVSTNGTSAVQVQLGDAGGVETTNYLGAIARSGAGTAGANNSAGFLLEDSGSASVVRHGSIVITQLVSTTNTWSAFGVIGRSDSANAYMQGGSKALSATLDRFRITTVNGTDTFDAGTINIMWEG